MESKLSLYTSNSLSTAQKAARFACERYLELGLPVLLIGSAKAHSGISMPSLNSKISRGYSFNIIGDETIRNLSLPFNKFSSTSLGILTDLNEAELLQLDLIFKIAKFQQREITSINNLQACIAWTVNNFFELPSWYGQLDLGHLNKIQKKLFGIHKFLAFLKDGNFSLSELKVQDYLGYGVCNLIDSDKLDKNYFNFILACLLELEAEAKPAIVIENISDENIARIIARQKSYSHISITSNSLKLHSINIHTIDADKTDLQCRSELCKTAQIETYSISPSYSASNNFVERKAVNYHS